METFRKFLPLVFVIIAITGGAVFFSLAFQSPPAKPQRATLLRDPAPLAEFSLLDHNGASFTNASLHGRWNLVFFGFTHCPDICPATLQQLSVARNRVLSSGVDGFPEVVLISVDPERDTPEAMARYLANFGDGFTGVTGTIDEVRRLTQSLGIYFHKSGSAGGGHQVDHSAAVMLVNQRGELRALFSSPHHVDYFVSDIPLITESS